MSRAPSFSRATRLLTLVATLGAPACSSLEAPNEISQQNPLDAEENAVVSALNGVRQGAGITTAIIVCTSLNVSASKHADDMRDQMYLADTAPDGSTVRTRSCAAGYQSGCDPNSLMAELVAFGIDTGKETFQQWVGDPQSNQILVNPGLVAVGVGRSLSIDGPKWALDLGGADEPSCH
jgi:uncharacterized protein YkwD